MEIAYLREFQHTKQCELAFRLKLLNENDSVILEEDLRSVRQLSDTVESLIQHTKNKIIKLLGDKENIELNILLTKGSKNISATTVCANLIKEYCKPLSPKKTNNLILQVCSQRFVILVNAPLINAIGLPSVVYIGFQLQATKFKSMFTEKHWCKNTWFTSADKEVWHAVGCDYKYTPTDNDLNKYIKLKCVPHNDTLEGPPFEVISSSTIQKMCPLPRCPFEDRHKLTNNSLQGSKLRIVSYNTLSSLYCDGGQFPYCTPEVLSIDYRKQLILKELEGYKADIICLQEMDFYIFKQYLSSNLSKRYKGNFHKKGRRISEGLACFYCSKRFRLLNVKHIVLSEELRTNPLFKSTLKLLQLSRNLKDNILKQPTSLQVTVLLKNDTKDVVIVANTHLYYHSEATEIRLIQSSLALDYIWSLVSKCERDPNFSKVVVIFCGDFNSVPESLVYTYFTNRMIHHTFETESEMPLSNICLRNPFQFASALGKPKYTNYTDDFKGCLDYIFYEKDKFNLIKCIPFPEESILSENTALPSKVFPSDHIALVTELQIL